MIEMASNSAITKVSRVFLRIYTYTARVGKDAGLRLPGVSGAWELES